MKKAYVVFSGKTELLSLFWLKRGFKHCYVLINDGYGWVSIDPMSHYIEIGTHRHINPEYDLAEWLRSRGNTVISCDIKKAIKVPLPPSFVSCVEICKRIIGVRKWWIQTPHQLYCHLIRERNEKCLNMKKT